MHASRKGTALGLVAMGGLVMGAFAIPAGAATSYKNPTGRATSYNVIRGASDASEAFLTGTYRCYGENGVLWASVKQGGPDPTAEGSSGTVDSWYDGHFALNCNGRTHRVTVEVVKQTKEVGEYADLHSGRSWIQWCVTDNHFNPETGDGLSSYSHWKSVRVAVGGMTEGL